MDKLVLMLTLGLSLNVDNVAKLSSVSGTKIDCYPIDGVTKNKCESLGCIWEPVNNDIPKEDSPLINHPNYGIKSKPRVDQPWCYFPYDYNGYEVSENNQQHSSALNKPIKSFMLRRVRPSVFSNDIHELQLDIEAYDGGNTLRVKIYDTKNQRFEPEIPKLNLNVGIKDSSGDKFIIELVDIESSDSGTSKSGPKKINIKRRSNGAILFSADLSKLIYSDKFIQLTSDLDSPYVYGLGEHYDTFLKWVDRYKVYSFYNFDGLPLADGQRTYGGFPFYINLDSTNQSQAHGVYLRNSNAMDIVLHPVKSVTFRPIGGILDFFIFTGPSSNDVVSQYQHLIGLPELPPRWSLGFHLCRYNYGSLNKTRLVWERTRNAGIPFDVQWNDIDYMDRYNDFTYDHDKYNGLPEFVKELHAANMYYMILFDPGVSQEPNYYPYQLGEEMNIFIKNATNQTLVGKVWNSSGRTVFPDFSNPLTIDYWSKLFEQFHKQLPFDGAWIDMNDISNFVDGSLHGCPWSSEPIETPPYKPGGMALQHHSLCLSAQHRAGLEYNLHNLYSFYEAIATQKALQKARPNRRSLLISRSTHSGQGHYGGHWSGDVQSSWEYLRWSIPSLLEHSLYGFNLMGSDICGFAGNTTSELCCRWSTLGAFYTFSRNHNDDVSIDQDPVALGPQVVEANKNALTKRYSLLPYLYSLMHESTYFGRPVARSIPFEYHSKDTEALRVEDQFMWGEALMISPILDQNTFDKTTFLPEGRWYETDILPSVGKELKVPKIIDSSGGSQGWYRSNNISLVNLPLFYRGGHIVPIYPNVKQTIAETIKQPIGLDVNLCKKGNARGNVYLDDGETLNPNEYHLFEMKVHDSRLTIEAKNSNYLNQQGFGIVRVYGVETKINGVELQLASGELKELDFEQSGHMLVFNLDVKQQYPIIARWH